MVNKSSCYRVEKSKVSHFQIRIIGWYNNYGRHFPWRKKSISNYQKIIVEALLQRTRAETVATFFPAFVQSYPNWISLARASEADLQQFLKPIGLWRRRAVSLVAFSQAMANRGGRFPHTREEIEKLPAVGQYMANAILLFCCGEPQPLLDTGMARVLERVFGERKLADIRYDPYLQHLAKAVVTSPDPVIMNWAILDLAALVCRPRSPRCPDCPLREICRHAKVIREAMKIHLSKNQSSN